MKDSKHVAKVQRTWGNQGALLHRKIRATPQIKRWRPSKHAKARQGSAKP